ncbi:MAG: hypothetical protein WC337_09430 [Candidatus Muiribacteriota bacterium]
MTINKMLINDLVLKITEDNKNVLFVDTCCVLDVLRCLTMQKIDLIKNIYKITEEFEKNENNFLIVFASAIFKEYQKNIETVKLEVENYCKKLFVDINNFSTLNEIVYKNKLNIYNLSNRNFPEILSKKTQDILKYGIHIELDEKNEQEIFKKVNFRICNLVPPSKKGKDSYSDCTIFEEFLLLGNYLHKNGFDKKIIFCSSNLKEYFEDNKVNKYIEQEVDKINGVVLKSIDIGYYDLISRDNL